MVRAVVALLLVGLSGGCAGLQGFRTQVSSIARQDGVVAIHSSPADLRSILVIQAPEVTRQSTADGVTTTTVTRGAFVCPQPPGDVAYSRTAEALLKLGVDAPASGTDATLETTLRTAAAAMELEGRTQSVLLARDMLSFTCVQAANGLIDGDASQANFNRIATMLEIFAQAEQARAGASTARAAADAANAGVNAALVQEMLAVRRTSVETRVANITANLTQATGGLNRTKLAALAQNAAVRGALSPGELQEFQQLQNLNQLRSFLIDLGDGQLATLENASK